MKKEVLSAVNFLVDLLRINSAQLTEEQLLRFRDHVCECLWHHYKDHWFPDKPMKGSGYRCIRINGKMDPLLEKAGELMGLEVKSLRNLFPSELTMWIDPREVAYRIGENGSICNLYVQKQNKTSSSATAPTTETTTSTTVGEEAPPKPPTPIKAAPPHHQPPSSPQFTIQHHFAPSNNNTSSQTTSVQFHSPPRSPVSSSAQQQLRAQQQQLALFLMSNHSAGNCKEALRHTSLEARGMERLFVSS